MAESSDVVHNRVAMLRAERRISRRELAEALGVHYETIGYLERWVQHLPCTSPFASRPSSTSRSKSCSR